MLPFAQASVVLQNCFPYSHFYSHFEPVKLPFFLACSGPRFAGIGPFGRRYASYPTKKDRRKKNFWMQLEGRGAVRRSRHTILPVCLRSVHFVFEFFLRSYFLQMFLECRRVVILHLMLYSCILWQELRRLDLY